MKPSEIDESLLTAYLDNELTDSERQLVEEQLMVSDHWKRLLRELQCVQNLVRELPKPILTRSLTEGPWSQQDEPRTTLPPNQNCDDNAQRRRYTLSLFAVAASLLLCVAGTFGWIRIGFDHNELARHTSNSNFSKATKDSIATAESVDSPAGNSIAIAPLKAEKPAPDLLRKMSRLESTGTGGFESELKNRESSGQVTESKENPQPNLKAASPTSTRQMSDGLAFGANPSERRAEKKSNDTKLNLSEPVETFYAVPLSTIADKLSSSKKDLPNDFDRPKQLADQWITFDFRDVPSDLTSRMSSITFVQNQRYELRILRSDLPAMIHTLSERGLKIQHSELPMADHFYFSKSEVGLNTETAKSENGSLGRPPILTGAIPEPSDWIRIVIEGS